MWIAIGPGVVVIIGSEFGTFLTVLTGPVTVSGGGFGFNLWIAIGPGVVVIIGSEFGTFLTALTGPVTVSERFGFIF